MDLGLAQLEDAAHIFCMLRRRNKNQHRHSTWWKWFSLLKRCVSKLIHEVQARDNLRVQARVRYMNQVLLPNCYASFTQLVQDTQFSTLGLTLVAELSKLQNHVAPCNDRAEAHIGPAAELVASRDFHHVILSEDVGETVGRSTWSNSADVGTHSVLVLDIVTESKHGRIADNRLHEREGTGLDAAKSVNGETEFPQPRAGASIASSETHASSAPVERQKQRRSVNAIDDLFEGLD